MKWGRFLKRSLVLLVIGFVLFGSWKGWKQRQRRIAIEELEKVATVQVNTALRHKWLWGRFPSPVQDFAESRFYQRSTAVDFQSVEQFRNNASQLSFLPRLINVNAARRWYRLRRICWYSSILLGADIHDVVPHVARFSQDGIRVHVAQSPTDCVVFLEINSLNPSRLEEFHSHLKSHFDVRNHSIGKWEPP